MSGSTAEPRPVAETVSEKRAHEDAELLGRLNRGLDSAGVRSRIFLRMRLAMGSVTILPRHAYHPTEMIVYRADGASAARVTVRTKLWGTSYQVSGTAPDAPEIQFPTDQVAGAVHWLALLARDDDPTTPIVPAHG
ncbi:hypothetical protein Sru01_58810 [Sphaerisporangium rufum]|uniref:Uncharacterized protein n=1 Tax=Sphaerisporangium rufum TaxID=1381558 RepID=A0A919R7I0_9ACTN|nr:hypothetical protein [Sphaerisporangium rufum]GII80899.1 hypothetical protein Sru01_58810 [Sphaerisporangium rufum]